ncbi:MAG: ABC transporter permease [Deltaproteobacteria bacterium]|jgi:NitT/TauT family transport system permease protein|nr:ABC transporter permease [Deltaproteobacteria bacterium]
MKGENPRHGAAFILGGFILFVFFWQAASMFLQLKALPPPLEVCAAWPRALEGGLPRHLAASLGRALSGLGLALFFGLALGVPMGCCPKADRLLGPLLYFSYPVPKLALLPVIMLLLGVGEASKITVLVLILVFQLILSIRDAVRAVPEEDYALLTSLKANFTDKLAHIILPAVLPAVFSSLRVSIGIVFSALFFTETFGTDQGLGYYVTDSQMRLDYPLMYLGILSLSLTALILFLLVDAADRLFCRWR